jgi:hypothetical protein
MATQCRAYPSEAAARHAIESLRTAGLPAQLIFGGRRHDRRREPIGEFAGLAAPEAPLGTFGDVTLERWRPGGAFAGDADDQRQGSFGDVDQHVIVSHDPGGGARRHIAGDRGVATLMQGMGLDPDASAVALEQLAAGLALVLVQVES